MCVCVNPPPPPPPLPQPTHLPLPPPPTPSPPTPSITKMNAAVQCSSRQHGLSDTIITSVVISTIGKRVYIFTFLFWSETQNVTCVVTCKLMNGSLYWNVLEHVYLFCLFVGFFLHKSFCRIWEAHFTFVCLCLYFNCLIDLIYWLIDLFMCSISCIVVCNNCEHVFDEKWNLNSHPGEMSEIHSVSVFKWKCVLLRKKTSLRCVFLSNDILVVFSLLFLLLFMAFLFILYVFPTVLFTLW